MTNIRQFVKIALTAVAATLLATRLVQSHMHHSRLAHV
jgi:hypothetical protein